MAAAWSQKNRDGVLTVKTTIRPDGTIVGRNYQGPKHRDKLRPGEIGVKMIIDPSQAEGELSEALVDALDEVACKARADLDLATVRFEPGTVIRFRKGNAECHAVVDRDDGDLLRVRYIGRNYNFVRRTVSLHSHEIEEVPDCFGAAGVIEALFADNKHLPQGFTRYNQRTEFLVQVLKRDFSRERRTGSLDPRTEVLEYVATLEDRSPYLGDLLSRVITRESKEYDLAEQAFALIPEDDEESMLTIATKAYHPNLRLTAIERVDESRRAEFYQALVNFARGGGAEGSGYTKDFDDEPRALALIPDSQVVLLCDLARGRDGVLRSVPAANRLTVELIQAIPVDSLADFVALMRAAHCSSHPDAKVYAVRKLSSFNLAEFDHEDSDVLKDVQYLELEKHQCLVEVLKDQRADQAVQLEAVGLLDLDDVDDFLKLLDVAMDNQPRQALIKRWLAISPLADWVGAIEEEDHFIWIAKELESLEEIRVLYVNVLWMFGDINDAQSILQRYAELGGDPADLKEEAAES